MENKFTKLSALVDDEFTVEKVWGYQFKMWDQQSGRMLTSEKYEKGYRKMYGLDTNKGKLDLTANQLANLFEAVQKDGRADINGRTFSVKSNGKTGIDIRYYINATKAPQKAPETVTDTFGVEDIPEFGMGDIPF